MMPAKTGLAAPMQAPLPQQRKPFLKAGFVFALFYVFFINSRVFDLALSNLHLPLLSFYLSIAFALVSGAFLHAFSSRIGLLLLGLTFWVMFAIPFSVWRSGSITSFKLWLMSMMTYVVIAGFAETYQHCRRVVYVMTAAIITLAVIAFLFGSIESGRLTLPEGKFQNPNDLAQMLLIGLPLCWFMATNPARRLAQRWPAFLALFLLCWNLARTGSRGGFIGFGVIVLAILARSRPIIRLEIAVGAIILIILAAFILPNSLKQRYFIVFKDNSEEIEDQHSMEAKAASSTESRLDLLKDSLLLTLRHPLLGVGPGQFQVAQNDLAQSRGARGNWQVTHNSYTQWSSENGVPAFVLFVAALIACIRSLKFRAPRAGVLPRDWAEIFHLAFCLRLSLISYAVSAAFASVAYQNQFTCLAGLAVAFSVSARQRLAALNLERPESQRSRRRGPSVDLAGAAHSLPSPAASWPPSRPQP